MISFLLRNQTIIVVYRMNGLIVGIFNYGRRDFMMTDYVICGGSYNDEVALEFSVIS